MNPTALQKYVVSTKTNSRSSNFCKVQIELTQTHEVNIPLRQDLGLHVQRLLGKELVGWIELELLIILLKHISLIHLISVEFKIHALIQIFVSNSVCGALVFNCRSYFGVRIDFE